MALAEREALFSTMRKLREDGIAMTIVGHNLDEIQEHSDVISVFRDGTLVETRESAEWTKSEIVQAMLGNHAHGADIAAGKHQSRTGTPPSAEADRKVALEVRELSSPGQLHDIEFTLYRGEILGIAGLVGSGRTELLRALAGADTLATGMLKTFESSSTTFPKNVGEARSRGISLQPEDRKGQGLLLSQSASDNIVLGEWNRESNGVFLNDAKLKEAAARAAAPVGYNTARMDEIAGNLSGGNQQKLLIARWLYTDYPILLADEPTRGVDVGAKSEILEALEEIVSTGRSMIVVSSELEEVIGLSDRVLVMHEGRILATLDASTDLITPERILQLIFDTADSSL
ncbi:ATP-binding cassette domain-containing protein [Leucobacter sp. Z1108]|uniref:ATP-binding cassette domain-containing protein n=1 Tax=Leucobacter sp. Z1108 TaxID=3439066 RepID=UPI003F32AFE6